MEIISQWRKQLRKLGLATAIFTNAIIFNHSSSLGQSNKVYTLLYNSRTNNEGIYTIQTDATNKVLMFNSQSDANTYANRLKMQNFPRPTVELINTKEILGFCRTEGYICQFIPAGTNITPPTDNVLPTQTDYKLLPNRSFK